jgi:hypothetical protein
MLCLQRRIGQIYLKDMDQESRMTKDKIRLPYKWRKTFKIKYCMHKLYCYWGDLKDKFDFDETCSKDESRLALKTFEKRERAIKD